MVAGNWYYFRIYHFEGSGGDSVTLAWSLPSQGPAALVNNDPSVSSFFVMDPLKTVNPANTFLEFVEEPVTSVSAEMNSRLELRNRR